MTKVMDKESTHSSNVNCVYKYIKYILYYISKEKLGIGQMIDSFVGDSQ